VKKIAETMKTMPATMATHAAAWKTLGVRWGAASGAGAGAVAIPTVRVSGVSGV
jgi:hypothetical protein